MTFQSVMEGVPPPNLHSILQTDQAARVQLRERRRARPVEVIENDDEDVHAPTAAEPAHGDARHSATTPDDPPHLDVLA